MHLSGHRRSSFRLLPRCLQWSMVVLSMALLMVLSLSGCGGGTTSAPSPTGSAGTSAGNTTGSGTGTASIDYSASFSPIYHDYVSLPTGVMPWAATWSPDGSHILFTDYNDNRGNEWLVSVNGPTSYGTPVCLTCSMTDRPQLTGNFSYVFPDNKRMFLANELGDLAYVLECAPSLYNCTSHQFFPIDLSADQNNLQPNLGRRTFHLAPDGVHLAYSMVRLDAIVMMVASLQKTAAGYAAVGYQVVNPPGPTGPLDMSAAARARGGQLYEFKTFVDGGRNAIVVGQPSFGNADMLKLDLATGQATRLTANPDWDEDGSLSPDGGLLLAESWRGMNRLSGLNVMPLSQPFSIYPLASLIAIYYASSHQGFGCDLQPWLLAGSGDKGGSLFGQPLAPYTGGNNITANNLAGLFVWSPDSTRVLIQERQLSAIPASANAYVQQKGTSPNRLLIARIDRPASAPVPAVTTTVGAWAKSPQAYQGVFALPGVYVIKGDKGGSAVVTLVGNVLAGQFTTLYNNFTNDGLNFLSGVELTVISTAGKAALFTANLTSTDNTGKQTGGLTTNLLFTPILPTPGVGQPTVTKTGTLTSSFNGTTGAALPDVGACPDSFPKPAQLKMSLTAQGGQLSVKVTTSIFGDQRPVRHALVSVGSQQVQTDNTGLAVLTAPPSGAMIQAVAGDTFLSVSSAAP